MTLRNSNSVERFRKYSKKYFLIEFGLNPVSAALVSCP